MRRIIISFLIIILIAVGVDMVCFKSIRKEPKGLISKFSWQGRKEMGEELLAFKRVGIPSFWPRRLAIRKIYLFVTDPNGYIYTLKINPDGNLVPRFVVGKKGIELGEFNGPNFLAIKDNDLYVLDAGNHRLQVLKINPDGNLTPKSIFGRRGANLGEFFLPLDLIIRGKHLYAVDAGNDRIQVLEMRYK